MRKPNHLVRQCQFHGYVHMRGDWVLIGGADVCDPGDPRDKLVKLLAVWDDHARKIVTKRGAMVKEWSCAESS